MTVLGSIRVSLGRDRDLNVQVQAKHRGKLCGYCGDFNGDPGNDWVIGDSPYCMAKYPDAVRGELVSPFMCLASTQ